MVLPWRQPRLWFLRSRNYFLYLLRELSSLFFLLYYFLYVYQLLAARFGPRHFAGFSTLLATPALQLLTWVMLFFAALHSITWFRLIGRVGIPRLGKVTPLTLRGRPVPAAVVVAVNLLIAAALSYVVFLLLLPW